MRLILMGLLFSAHFSHSGSNVGAGNQGIQPRFTTQEAGDDLEGECSSAIDILKDALETAERAFKRGNIVQARTYLVSGLSEAKKSFKNKTHGIPLTKKAIDRGETLDTIFNGVCVTGKPECLELDNRTAVSFLSSYYDYILNTVWYLDNNYYIKYLRHYRNCPSYECMPESFGIPFFENYRGAARALLKFYNNPAINGGLAFDLYEARLAERIFLYAATDLDFDTFRRHFSCLISEMKSASKRIAEFNSGHRGFFENVNEVVRYSHVKSTNFERILENQNSCITNPWRRP